MKKIITDTLIIGAGPAGIMSAIWAAKSGHSVVLLESNSAPGKKLLLTGNGRCNLTNAEFNLRELVKNYNNGEFLFHAFSIFGPKEVVDFFEKIGVNLKTEDNKRVFPKSNKADYVLSALNKCLTENNVKLLFDSEVTDAVFKNKKIDKLVLKNCEIKAQKYILCTGGKTYPQTGSKGFGYKLAEKVGHTIEKLKPALCPLITKEGYVKNLQGISLENTEISVWQNGKKIIKEQGTVIFTHFGVSGPAILNISGKVGELLEKGEVVLSIDLFPLLNYEEVLKEFENMLKRYPTKTTINVLSIFLPDKVADVLLGNISIEKNKIANNLSKLEKMKVVKILKGFQASIEDVFGFEQSLVTRGGVSLKEIDHKTMKSKLINNLSFAGEIINVDGKTGGFNLQLCWSTGYLAGKSVIKD